MRAVITTDDAPQATLDKLAEVILARANGDNIDRGIALVAAKEIARRILPEAVETPGRGQQPIGSLSNGLTPLSAAEKRRAQAHIDSFSVGRK